MVNKDLMELLEMEHRNKGGSNIFQLSRVNLIKGYSVKPLINCSILPCIIYLVGDEAFYQLSCRRRRSGATTRSARSIPTPLRHVDRF